MKLARMERRGATGASPWMVSGGLALARIAPTPAFAQDASDIGVTSDDPAAELAVAHLADALRAEGIRVSDASSVRAAFAFLGPDASLHDPATLSALRQRLELDRVVSIWRDPESVTRGDPRASSHLFAPVQTDCSVMSTPLAGRAGSGPERSR